jgi:hypothetical protein
MAEEIPGGDISLWLIEHAIQALGGPATAAEIADRIWTNSEEYVPGVTARLVALDREGKVYISSGRSRATWKWGVAAPKRSREQEREIKRRDVLKAVAMIEAGAAKGPATVKHILDVMIPSAVTFDSTVCWWEKFMSDMCNEGMLEVGMEVPQVLRIPSKVEKPADPLLGADRWWPELEDAIVSLMRRKGSPTWVDEILFNLRKNDWGGRVLRHADVACAVARLTNLGVIKNDPRTIDLSLAETPKPAPAKPNLRGQVLGFMRRKPDGFYTRAGLNFALGAAGYGMPEQQDLKAVMVSLQAEGLVSKEIRILDSGNEEDVYFAWLLTEKGKGQAQ